jgi:hypothetical protein
MTDPNLSQALREAISTLMDATRAECRDGPHAPVEEAQEAVEAALSALSAAATKPPLAGEVEEVATLLLDMQQVADPSLRRRAALMLVMPGRGEGLLPCDVHLPPATVLRKGVKLSTLHLALRVRGMVESVPVEQGVDAAWQELIEKDDRTSPAEYPDMALITKDELSRFIAASRIPMPSEAEITDTELLAILANDPNAVHINLLRRSLARPTVSQIIHIYGEDAIRAALSAASAVRSEGVVKVRDLKWGAIGAARQIFSADTAMGEYTVEYYEEPGVGAGWSAVYQDGHELGDYATEAEAKSAAQEHYTNAVLSAITSPVQTREDGIRTEAQFLLDRLNDFEPELPEGEAFRQYAGHVSPSVERLRALLSQPEPKGDKA